ncbi:MAG: hypothetical protein IJ595_09260 [Oscillospiraceae bacterium]|nr:hypothetical protein [Oscillospiraceae bacterium]
MISNVEPQSRRYRLSLKRFRKRLHLPQRRRFRYLHRVSGNSAGSAAKRWSIRMRSSATNAAIVRQNPTML